MSEKKLVLFGAGKLGLEALKFFGVRNVAFFVDNKKAGTVFCGKPVKSVEYLQEVAKNYDVVLSVGDKFCSEISKQLSALGIAHTTYFNMRVEWEQTLTEDLLIYSDLLKFRGLHKGKSCFLIGNGSSLRIQDLEMLKAKGYCTFACNLINRLFDKTEWRPDYYCAAEPSIIAVNIDYIKKFDDTVKFVSDLSLDNEFSELMEGVSFPNNVYLYTHVGGKTFCVSEQIEKSVYGGYTTMFHMIQFAFYMGFSKIYFLGVENTQLPTVHNSNFLEANTHFYAESQTELDNRRKILRSWKNNTDEVLYLERLEEEYTAARDYAEKHGIKIFNATRGGRLEVFERVDFDSIFKGE